MDSSRYSLAAVRQADALAQAIKAQKPGLTLLHGIDEAILGLSISQGTEVLVAQVEAVLASARFPLKEAVLDGLWEEKLVTGNPARVIREEAEAGLTLHMV